jgi:hypothetical protein
MATLVETKVISPERYAGVVKQLLGEHAAYRSRAYQQARTDERSITLFDEVQNRYALIDLGWYEGKYGRKLVVLLELVNGKLWIHQDDTEDGIANEFVELGVPNTNIVLAFRPPELRPYTGFATE